MQWVRRCTQRPARYALKLGSSNPVVTDRFNVLTVGFHLGLFGKQELEDAEQHRVVPLLREADDPLANGQKHLAVVLDHLPLAQQCKARNADLGPGVDRQCGEPLLALIELSLQSPNQPLPPVEQRQLEAQRWADHPDACLGPNASTDPNFHGPPRTARSSRPATPARRLAPLAERLLGPGALRSLAIRDDRAHSRCSEGPQAWLTPSSRSESPRVRAD